jgi:pSer/pThr/pTyr-binding forkhead associated (FHA) protein
MAAEKSPTKIVNVPQSQQAERQEADFDDLRTVILAGGKKASGKVVGQVGKLTIVDGPGQGTVVPLFNGTNTLGRSTTDNTIGLDHGDTAISRVQHAIIEYDPDFDSFRLLDGGKANPVYINGAVVAGAAPFKPGDRLKVGVTTLELARV